MKTKKIVALISAGVLVAGALTGVILSNTATPLSLTNAEGHTYVEKAYEHPSVGSAGLKAYYMDSTTCATEGPDSSRYEYKDYKKDPQVLTHISMANLTIPALTTAEAPSGDLITAINPAKYKYVDQGVNGVGGVEGTSTPFYVSDGGHTSLFLSRSGKTGDPLAATDNTDCSEFRFTADKTVAASITFSYRYLDYGTGYWNTDPSTSDPGQIKNAHFMIQMKDSGKYFGQAVTLINDDAWHTITVTYAAAPYHWVSGAVSTDAATSTTSLTDIIFKFVDLRGHIFVSGLSTSNKTALESLKDGTAFEQAVTNASEVSTYTGAKLSLPAAWVSKAIAEGYTHFRLHVNAVSATAATVSDVLLSDSVAYTTYFKTNVPDNDIRVTLTTINSDDGGIKIEGRSGATAAAKTAISSAFTVSDFHLYKSSETLSWAQPTASDALSTYSNVTSSSNLYVAYEDGELVIDNIGGNPYEKVVVVPEKLVYNHSGIVSQRIFYNFLGSQDGNCYDDTVLRTTDKICRFQSVGGTTLIQGGSDADNDAYGYSYMTRTIENGNGLVLGLAVPTAMKFKLFDLVSWTGTAPATSAWAQQPNTYADDGTTIYHVNITNTTWQYFNFAAPKGATSVVVTMTSDKIIENADPAARLAAFDDLAASQIKMNTITRTGSAGAYSYAATTIGITGKVGWTARYGADGDGNTADMPAGTSISVTFDYYYVY